MPKRRASESLLSNHQKSWLWGTVAVWETLQTGRWPIRELVLSEQANQPVHADCRQLAEERGIPCRDESPQRIEQLCKAKDHQGILALLGPFPYAAKQDLLDGIGGAAVLLMLDRLQDPFNFGAIVRTAAALGIEGVIIGSRGQAAISSHVVRSSAGAVNHVPICRVDNLQSMLAECRDRGCQPLAATMDGEIAVDDVRSLPEFRNAPLLLIIGNEAEGVDSALLEQCTATVHIPMRGAVESLNAAVAAGILMFALRPVDSRTGANSP